MGRNKEITTSMNIEDLNGGSFTYKESKTIYVFKAKQTILSGEHQWVIEVYQKSNNQWICWYTLKQVNDGLTEKSFILKKN